ncbi:MAG: response regulator [Planctomycetota bacterium]
MGSESIATKLELRVSRALLALHARTRCSTEEICGSLREALSCRRVTLGSDAQRPNDDLQGIDADAEFSVELPSEEGLAACLTVFGLQHALDASTLSLLASLLRSAVPAILKHARKSKSLENALATAEQANRSKALFLANVSHEIRTPMTAIVGYSRLLAADNDPLRHGEWSQLIRHNADHLLSLIDDVLDLSRIDAGELPVHVEPVHLPNLIDATMEWFGGQASERMLELRHQIGDEVPEGVRTDPGRIRQILANLVGHAIERTSRGFVELSVDRVEHEGQSMIRMRVIDTGEGIPPEHLAEVFEPFSDAKQSGPCDLGLAIANALAERLGGCIEVESLPGVGSRFDVLLPLEASEPPSSADEDAESETIEKTPLSSRHVLIVDDSEDNRAILNLMLEREGARCRDATDGLEAFERVQDASAEEDRFDVVLMDLQMPNLDGFGALRKIREAGHDLPVVALTAFAMDNDRRRCLEAGFDAYLTKPIDEALLFRSIRSLIDPTSVADSGDPTVEVESGVPEDGVTQGSDWSPQALRSPLASDPIYAELVGRYVDNLEKIRDEVLAATSSGSDLERVAHRIKGTAGNYQFAALHELSGSIEQRLRNGEPIESVAPLAQDLADLIDAVREIYSDEVRS